MPRFVSLALSLVARNVNLQMHGCICVCLLSIGYNVVLLILGLGKCINSRNLFLTVPEAGTSRSMEAGEDSCPVFLLCPLTWQKRQGDSLESLFSKDTNPSCEGSTVMILSPARGPPTSIYRHIGG